MFLLSYILLWLVWKRKQANILTLVTMNCAGDELEGLPVDTSSDNIHPPKHRSPILLKYSDYKFPPNLIHTAEPPVRMDSDLDLQLAPDTEMDTQPNGEYPIPLAAPASGITSPPVTVSCGNFVPLVGSWK
ncbi:hypothetical protein DFH07DRAFT_1032727 [Mycena maculata]|uniref:Uncharacterized protein n=1 Tax=Mycena maculata TaxID=230809 RepID=A0AAD7IX98_9AGAR|nr:hypothetical protein DFH07DRAFT_1032727 [Mycena maculata]